MASRAEREVEGYILDGMARAIWVHAYMIWATEVEPAPVMGSSWEEMAPNNAATRRASMQAAKALTKLIGEALPGRDPLVYLFEHGVAGGRRTRGATEADLAYAYGNMLALVCIGSFDRGDSVLPLPADFYPPQFRVALEDDGRELTWDGGVDLEGAEINPAPRGRRDQPRPPPDGVRVTPQMAQDLAALRKDVPAMMSDEAARRLIARIDTALKTGIVDEGTASYVEGGWEPLSWMPNPAGGPTVLVLEDDPQLQRAIGRWIKKIFGAGTHLVVSDNVDAAIANLGVHQVKLIVSDVDVLGNKSGIDLFEWVRTHKPELVDRYVFFTGGHPEVAQIHRYYLPKGDTTFEDFRAMWSRMAAGPAPTPPPAPRATTPPPMSLAQFADAVHAAMPQIRQEYTQGGLFRGRVGADKVFISALWRVLEHDPRFRGMTLAQFKRRLVDANREEELALVRADSQGDMDPSEDEISEIQDMGATFHLVVDPSASRSRRAPAPASDADLRKFATLVHAELPYIVAEEGANGRAKGRFGRKVFIAALWRQLRTSPAFHGMPFEDFKRSLYRAHQQSLLVLARADLVAAMDSQEVAESELRVPGAEFHLVVDE